jgi:hypothetical protein
MIRLTAFAALVLAGAPARADDPAAAPLRIIDATFDSGQLKWEETVTVPVQVEKVVQVVENGVTVSRKVTVTEVITQKVPQAMDVKSLKTTDVAGKAVAADKLVPRLSSNLAWGVRFG